MLSAFFAGDRGRGGRRRPALRRRHAGWETIGRSEQGRPIRALRVGQPPRAREVLVVGAVHGNEQAGRAVVARLRRARPPRGTALWLVDDANPDGSAAGTRHNAHGVDLNRNFPYRWQPQDGVYESGPGPASEPETQVMQRFIERERPRVTLWYHQALRIVVKSTGDPKLERLYSARSGLPRRSLPRYHGTAISWQNTHASPATAPSSSSCPAARCRPPASRRHAGAVLALARAVAPPREVREADPVRAGAAAPTWPTTRERHYGIHDFRLRDPQVIVEHYTVTSSFAPVFDYFSRNEPDPELNELPGVCSHYVIDRDGTIYRLVPTSIMCRHTVGLNWTAIGIEHVGHERRPGDGQPPPARRLAAAHARAPGPLRHRAPAT